MLLSFKRSKSEAIFPRRPVNKIAKRKRENK
jgi:hypothetical protein